MERSPMFLDRQISIVKMVLLPKALCKFNASPIKIPMTFLIEIEKAIMNFIWKNKRPQIAKTILSNKSEAGDITIPGIKLYYRAIVTKTAWYQHQNRQVDWWYRKEDMETYPHKYSNLILDKGAKNVQWKKDSLFKTWCCQNWKSICSKMKLNPCLSPCTYSTPNGSRIQELDLRPFTKQKKKQD